MEVEKEILELKAELKLARRKMDALLSILGREGIIDEDDLDDQMESLKKK